MAVSTRAMAMDPESAKRLASGFWKHEASLETGEDRWTCNVAKLREELHKICVEDRRMYERFCENPDLFLDARYGDMTAKAFRYYSKGDRISFKTTQERLEDMAGLGGMYNAYSSGWIDPRQMGTTNTNTNVGWTGTSATSVYDYRMWEEMQRRAQQAVIQTPVREKKIEEIKAKAVKKKTPYRNIPFVNGGDSLVATLQRDFDRWAGPQMRELHG